MKCKIIECSKHDDCTILEIINKEPKKAESCSYFKSTKQLDKLNKKATKSKEDLENYKNKKKKKKT